MNARLEKILKEYNEKYLIHSGSREYCHLSEDMHALNALIEKINIDTFIEFMQDPQRNYMYINIRTSADNIMSWNIINNIKICFVEEGTNIIFWIDNIKISIMTQNNMLTTINYLLNKCIDAQFYINGITVVQDKLENSTKYNNNAINICSISETYPLNILTHNSISTLDISILNNYNFMNIVLPNITTIKFDDIHVSIESFERFFNNNPTITTVYFLGDKTCDLYYKTFVNNVNVIELHIQQLKCSTMRDLFHSLVLEKLVIHRLIVDDCDITFISNNIKYLYVGGTYFTQNELKILIRSQLLYLNVRVNVYYKRDIQILIDEYPNSIALASLIKNKLCLNSHLQFANNLIAKKRTLQYFCDTDTVLEKQFDNETNL